MNRFRAVLILSVLSAATLAAGWDIQSRHPILNRWVGTNAGRPWWLDFYGDTMLIVDDTLVLDFRLTSDSLIASGDTSFSVAYWFVRDRLLIHTNEGDIITMAPQDRLARPMDGEWRGEGMRLRIWRGGVATFREASGTSRSGEWNRRSRSITFTWFPDSLTWSAQYDPLGNALLATVAEPDGSTRTAILWKAYRW